MTGPASGQGSALVICGIAALQSWAQYVQWLIAGLMTMADIDIWRTATLLINRHGAKDAAIVAAQRADECRASGDTDGRMTWNRIVIAILEMLRTELRSDERVN
jgi:hypothetical protein